MDPVMAILGEVLLHKEKLFFSGFGVLVDGDLRLKGAFVARKLQGGEGGCKLWLSFCIHYLFNGWLLGTEFGSL